MHDLRFRASRAQHGRSRVPPLRLATSLLVSIAMTRHELHCPIRDFMTPSPHSIGRSQSLSTALDRMRAHDVRHLPVLDGGRIVGVLSQRDVLFVETLRDVDPSTVRVEEAMSTEVYAVAPDVPLAEVAAEMAQHKYGCVAVVDHGHVAGIFTSVDALRALVVLLGPSGDGRAVASARRA
jgi:acetoin utilization protein AcuB